MSTRVLRGLLLEHTTRTWPFYLAALFLGFIYVVFQWSVQGRTSQGDVETTAQAIVLIVAGLGLLYSAADGDRLSCELTERTLLLPVSTITLVGSKFLYNSASIAGLSICVHTLLRISPLSGPHDTWWAHPIAGVMNFGVLQTVALMAGCLGDWALGILIAVLIGMMTLVGESWDDFATPSFLWKQFVLFTVCILISYEAVHLRRTGRWDPQLLLPTASRIQTGQTETLKPFATAFEAQRWFEIRRIQGYFLPIFIVLASTVALFGVTQRWFSEHFIEDYTNRERLLWAAGQYGILLVYVFLITCIFAGGVVFFQNFRMQTGTMQSFLFLRPLSTADLGRARFDGTLRVLGGNLLVAVMVAVGLCSLWLAIGKDNPSTLLTQRWGTIQLAAILLLVFAGVAAAGWIAFWTGNILGMFALVIGFEMFRTYLNDYHWLNYFSESSEWISVSGISVILGAILILAARKGFLAPLRLVICLFTATAFSGALWFAGYWDDIWSTREVPWNFNLLYKYCVAALLLALPLATVPLSLHWTRHR